MKPKTNLFPLRHRYNGGRPRQPRAPKVRLGRGQIVAANEQRARWLAACSKGGKTTASRPNAGRFTSETGTQAAQKIWRTRWRKVNGIRIGRARNTQGPKV